MILNKGFPEENKADVHVTGVRNDNISKHLETEGIAVYGEKKIRKKTQPKQPHAFISQLPVLFTRVGIHAPRGSPSPLRPRPPLSGLSQSTRQTMYCQWRSKIPPPALPGKALFVACLQGAPKRSRSAGAVEEAGSASTQPCAAGGGKSRAAAAAFAPVAAVRMRFAWYLHEEQDCWNEILLLLR